MVEYIAGGIDEVIYARLDAHEDLLEGIERVVQERNITTGIVMSITGALARARLSGFPNPGPLEWTSVEVREIPGPMEASGHGIIGVRADRSSYIHVHLVVTNGIETSLGHLERGTIVRSLLPISHFTIVLASVNGLTLRLLEDATAAEQHPERFPLGALYHELVQ